MIDIDSTSGAALQSAVSVMPELSDEMSTQLLKLVDEGR